MKSYGLAGLIAVVLVLTLVDIVSTQTEPGYRLQRDASYFVVAPQRIRPNQVMQISVSVMQMYTTGMEVRAIIRRDREELASALRKFDQPGTQLMQMRVCVVYYYSYIFSHVTTAHAYRVSFLSCCFRYFLLPFILHLWLQAQIHD